jgi:hypothetical protein
MQPLLAELLLRRKELQLKVDQLHGIRRDQDRAAPEEDL